MLITQDVVFTYTNYRGETRERRVRPIRMYFGSTEYHDDPQWLLVAKDLERDVERTFAMKDIKEWAPAEAAS